ncbi:MAG: molecular chaperone [Pseudomonadota bacterium]
MHRFTVSAALLWLLTAGSQAAMYVDRSQLTFKPGQAGRQDLTITNPDNETLYVKVEVSEILGAGTENEERRVAKAADDIRLLATPNKLVIPPGQQKTVRLVNLAGHGDSERVYRVNVTPVVGKLDVPDGQGLQVKVVVAYDLLVLVAPAKPTPSLLAERNGNSISFRNTGNTNIYLYNGQQCPAADAPATECRNVNGKRLYPGNEWITTLPFDRPVDFFLDILDTHEKRRFD